MTKSVLENIADELRATREEFAASMDEPLHCEQLDASELIDKAADAIAANPSRELLLQMVSHLYNIVHDNIAIFSPSARHFTGKVLDELEWTDPPEPGGVWAQELGCTCHAPPAGYLDVSPPEVKRDRNCPLHGSGPDERRER